jgi:hypothetical protein
MDKMRKKITPIARKRHNYVYLLFSILFAIISAYLFVNYPPTYKFNLLNFWIPILPLFLFSISAFIFSLTTFIFIQKTQGLILVFVLNLYLILRLVGLTHFIFAILVLALFITLELFVIKKK